MFLKKKKEDIIWTKQIQSFNILGNTNDIRISVITSCINVIDISNLYNHIDDCCFTK